MKDKQELENIGQNVLIHNPKTCQSRSASLRIEIVPSRGDRIPEKSKSDREKPAAF